MLRERVPSTLHLATAAVKRSLPGIRLRPNILCAEYRRIIRFTGLTTFWSRHKNRYVPHISMSYLRHL